MFNCGKNILGALIIWILWNVSLADDPLYVCLLDDPSPNDCDSFCITTLRPKLDSLVDQQTKMKAQLQGLETKLEESLTRLEGQLEAVLTKLDNQMQTVETVLPQQGSKEEPNGNEIPPGYERMGSRYFLIIERAQNRTSAAKTCWEKGGYLASIQNEKEFDAINARLDKNKYYWIDFPSEASYSKWHPDYLFSNYLIRLGNDCVYMGNGYMLAGCDVDRYLICQADNENDNENKV